jgi:hypothetical protein
VSDIVGRLRIEPAPDHGGLTVADLDRGRLRVGQIAKRVFAGDNV